MTVFYRCITETSRNVYRNILILDLYNRTTVFSSPAGVWCLEFNDVDLLVMIRT